MLAYQNPYMEQQFPFGQLPQTVLLFEVPQLPSVVTTPVAVVPGAVVVDTGPITGSAGVEVGGGSAITGVVDGPSVQPFWHPLIVRQCSGVEPQYL